MILKCVFRSTSVSNTESSLVFVPIHVSNSQCPKCFLVSTFSGRSLIEEPSTRRFFRCFCKHRFLFGFQFHPEKLWNTHQVWKDFFKAFAEAVQINKTN